MADEQRNQRPLDYARPPDARVSPVAIVLGVVSLICGVILVLLAVLLAIFNLRSQGSWADRFIPILVMTTAGAIACVIGIRALRRWRRVREALRPEIVRELAGD